MKQHKRDKFKPPIATIGLPEQRAMMNQLHPQFECEIIKKKGNAVLVCRGDIQPTPINNTYTARIEYITRKKPKVWIESPKLVRFNADEMIPHTYADDRPCLFKEDFVSDMHIAATVVPWLMLWIMFYEAWRVTGEWQGEGLHPVVRDIRTELAA